MAKCKPGKHSQDYFICRFCHEDVPAKTPAEERLITQALIFHAAIQLAEDKYKYPVAMLIPLHKTATAVIKERILRKGKSK